ncbi:MAG: preprotein translocase subunit YajC [Prevotellaceae bacterium]|jgi:preprotein translocase subunit YajC|nr:preprotein translocase subunit YajC [Prevotellaceae bacterium]
MTLNILLQEAVQSGQQGGFLGGGWQNIAFLVLIFVVFYFFLIRPQQKKQKDIQKAREAIKTGDKVVLGGGIYGKVREIKDTTFIVEIAENVRVKVEKTSVFASAEGAE